MTVPNTNIIFGSDPNDTRDWGFLKRPLFTNGKAIEVVDDFLSEEEHARIQHTLTSERFDWKYGRSAVGEDSYDQFVHMFYKANHLIHEDPAASEYMPICHPILTKIDPVFIVRVKANATAARTEEEPYYFHTDFLLNDGLAGVYYVNSNNGATVFEDGTEVESVANRFVCFTANTRHGVRRHTSGTFRLVINFNWIPKLETNTLGSISPKLR